MCVCMCVCVCVYVRVRVLCLLVCRDKCVLFAAGEQEGLHAGRCDVRICVRRTFFGMNA